MPEAGFQIVEFNAVGPRPYGQQRRLARQDLQVADGLVCEMKPPVHGSVWDIFGIIWDNYNSFMDLR